MSPMAHSATTDDHDTPLLILVPFAADQEHPGMLVDVPGDRSDQREVAPNILRVRHPWKRIPRIVEKIQRSIAEP